jgi:Putative Actinobacterial Holin-X, holin superfamily III
MRTVNLARVAAQAEVLRLRRQGRRMAFRAGYGAVAGIFVLAFLVAAHVAIVLALEPHVQLLPAVLIVSAGDLVIALILGWLAARGGPDAIEREAMQVKETALAQLRETLALTTVVGPALRLVGPRKVYGLALAALTARYLGGHK